jgi:hypothetical protein
VDALASLFGGRNRNGYDDVSRRLKWGNMNTSRAVAGTVLLGLALSSCSSPAPQAAPTVSVAPASTPSPTPTPTPTRNENARGQLIKAIGETASWMTDKDSDVPTMTFKVTSIQPITCDASYAPPLSGTMIALNVEVATTSNFSGPLVVNGQEGLISFDSHYWKGYAANGTRMNAVDSSATSNCLADKSKLLPSDIGKGEQLNGLVLLDVTSPSGEVAFQPTGANGWVWKYPST